MTPFLSIIIPTYNAGSYLEECLSSLAPQLADDIELLVQDGGSTDATHDILERHSHLFSQVNIRRDHGQSDAIDRGIETARGRFVTWLNGDDVLMPRAIDTLRRAVIKSPNIQWWVGSTAVLDKDGMIQSTTRAGQMLYDLGLRFVSAYGPSSIFTRRLYDSVGGIDLSFHYMMDTDLWHRFATAGFRYSRLPGYVWGFRQHEESKTTAHLFSGRNHDPFSPAEFRQNAERTECHLRHDVHGESTRELFSSACAKLIRILDLSYPRQILDQSVNRGRHWSTFHQVL